MSKDESKRLRVGDDEQPDAARLNQMASLLDLTSLNDDDTDSVISSLCERARRFNVAAVCVFPRFVRLARSKLADRRDISVATVANFPSGECSLAETLESVRQSLSDGADEIDVVLPYSRFKAGEEDYCREFLANVRQSVEKGKLKVIIESGELGDRLMIEKAALFCIVAGADFVKTSTGKTKISATLEAADAILSVISTSNRAEKVGMKVSGGIRTVPDALAYMKQAETRFGAISKENFRIGASGLLGNIEKRLHDWNGNTAEAEGDKTATRLAY